MSTVDIDCLASLKYNSDFCGMHSTPLDLMCVGIVANSTISLARFQFYNATLEIWDASDPQHKEKFNVHDLLPIVSKQYEAIISSLLT